MIAQIFNTWAGLNIHHLSDFAQMDSSKPRMYEIIARLDAYGICFISYLTTLGWRYMA